MSDAPEPLAGVSSTIPIADTPVRASTPVKYRPGDFVGYLYRCYDKTGRLIYIGATSSIHQRMNVHSRQSVFHDRIADVRYWYFANVEEARAAEEAAIRAERPPLNRQKNPDYEGRPRAEQSVLFTEALAAIPVAAADYKIRDGRPPEVVVAEMRAAMERLSATGYGSFLIPKGAA